MNATRKITLTIILATAFAIGGFVDIAMSQGNGGGRKGPPPEAYTACEGKSAGEAAEFTSPFGDAVTGVCVQKGDRLVLRPDRHGGSGESSRGKRRHGPPPEAYTACEDLSAGDAAEFTSRRGDTVTGVCESEGDRLVLRPDHPGERPDDNQ